MTGNLTEFLSARLAEDECTAQDATPDEWIVTHDPLGVHVENGDGRGRIVMHSGDDRRDGRGAQNAAHIARHDPARVLREVKVKRAVVDAHALSHFRLGGDSYCATCSVASGWPCPTLRLLAASYGDHPDYRAEWLSSSPPAQHAASPGPTTKH